MFNPFKKKRPAQEEQGGGEPYFPPELERFRNRSTSDAGPIEGDKSPSSFLTPVRPLEFPYQPEQPSILEVPEKERKFRAFAREMENPSDIGIGFERNTKEAQDIFPQGKPAVDADKLDMVLQKLETIDLRLRLIEQKMERRPI